MKLDFNTEIDLSSKFSIKSLEFYLYTYRFIYLRRGISETDEENLRKSLVFNTYQQILVEYNESKVNNPIEPNLKILDIENKNNQIILLWLVYKKRH